MKVVVGMSGGVDSSVTALLLRDAGHEVVGLSLGIWDQRVRTDPSICCSEESLRSASTVCRHLGMEHRSLDARGAFSREVIEPFCRSYLDGETPNPCVLCNQSIKFSFLLDAADEMGADAVATGHYARVRTQGGRYGLLKGLDKGKDQSYFLYVMRQAELSRTLFPLGGMEKEDVRRIARDAGLSVAERPESQDICFVGSGGYRDFIAGVAPEMAQPGPFVDMDGRVLGRHSGVAFYTVGQRRGLGIPAGSRLYVTGIDRTANTIVLGPREQGMKAVFSVNDVNWISPIPEQPFRAAVRIRSVMREVPALVSPEELHAARVEFDRPQWAPAPGQAAVFYGGDDVLGGGTICEE